MSAVISHIGRISSVCAIGFQSGEYTIVNNSGGQIASTLKRSYDSSGSLHTLNQEAFDMREPEVVQATHAFLNTHGIGGHAVLNLFTDSHSSLVPHAGLAPFQQFTLDLEGMTLHPDLVGRLTDGETMFAVEAKGEEDLLQGLAQAAAYRFGFHRSFLAIGVDPPGDLYTLARQQQVGLIVARPTGVMILEVPPPHLPRLAPATNVARQFSASVALRVSFMLNMPTHYLSVAVALRGHYALSIPDLEAHLRTTYSVLPKVVFEAAVRGAERLGLVIRRADVVEMTRIGVEATALLPNLSDLAEIHNRVKSDRRATLASTHHVTGSVLRWLLAPDPVVTLIVDTLKDLGAGPHPLPRLARQALARDKALAMIVFFAPERVATITTSSGRIDWSLVQSGHYRSTTSYHIKSILRQAGIIKLHPLRPTTGVYNPEHDLWELI
jgi:hypothetical protein